MNATAPFDPALLGDFFSAATQHASLAMSQWTNGRVSLSLDELREAPLEEVSAELDMGDDLLTMVVLGVQGDGVQGGMGGQLILAFDDENGRTLAASLLGREVVANAGWSELDQSAVMETGNILASAYLNELTRLTRRKLIPSAPFFVQDFGASVLAQVLAGQSLAGDRALICRTRFEFDQRQVNWSLFFVPSEELLQTLLTAVQTSAANA
ncbi:chemotaxis protein CheC [Anatilimnocola floriformis]|uniref:chemotaxis protein CheC n=1 Tax=Anatilimnocola floriformis TaxID=2948575 RepID=UPI0020C53586|nr:chemotaxis protein CheC [Anatilimnocola floriformis]